MNDARLPSRETLRRVLGAGALSDALDSLGIWSVLPPALRLVGGPQRKFFGKAYTVCWGPVRKGKDIRAPMPNTWSSVRNFLAPELRDGKGIVYVAGTVGEPILRFALAGGLSSGHFDRMGMEAMVLGGAMRDVEDLASRTLPIWAMSTSPADTQGNYSVVSVGSDCLVGDVRVRTGDLVFGDTTGAVAIPQEAADEVIRRALAIVEAEAEIRRKVDAGGNLVEILERSGHI
jgi:regulator of RNase E activity RraA